MSSGYLIRNGTVYDGSGGAPINADVRVRGDIITEIAPDLPLHDEQVIDAAGLLVTPGLIDLHTHVYSGMGLYSVDAEEAGIRTGVTTLLDTGTAGALTYPTFHRFIMPQAKEDIFALLNISMIGCVQGHPDYPPYMGDLNDGRHADVPSAVACIEKYRDRIIGTKVRLTSALANYSLENEQRGLYGALEAAEKTGLPCMIHHAMSQIPTAEVMDALRPGDIYTHLYNPYPDCAFLSPDKHPHEAMLRARERGVLFDVGHGVGAFAWATAEPACQEHNFWPDTISTDIHSFNIQGPVFNLTTTMTKFLHLGMPLPAIVKATTEAPAAAMRLTNRFGRLLPGRQADITLLKVEEGSWELIDSVGEVRHTKKRIVPIQALKRGELYDCVTA